MAGISLAGCKHDVDLKNISVDSEVNVKLNNLPIGEFSTTFGEMVGLIKHGENDTIIYNEKTGLLELMITEHHEKEFHKIVLKDYIGKIEDDKLIQKINPSLTIIPAKTEMDIPFDLTINFDGVNDDTSDERLDSMVIDDAEFMTRITTTNLGITDADIQKVTMVLGPQFRRAKGTSIELPNFRLNKDILITLDKFTLVMMEDEKEPPSNHNIINTATITFVLTLKTGENVVVASNSGFHFVFQVDFMDYSALYGYFSPGEDTNDEDSVKVDISLPNGEPLIVPISDPEINMTFTYAMSMPLEAYFHYLKAMHPKNDETLAKWYNNTTTTEKLRGIVPVDTTYDATAQSTIRLTKDEALGQIDRFFAKELKYLGYKYDLLIDRNTANIMNMNQFRLTKNTQFIMDFTFRMPFEFNKGLNVAFADTLKDITLERASLDSLSALTNGAITDIDSTGELTLYLLITNEIPIALTLDATFLDENNDSIPGLGKLHDIKIESATMPNPPAVESKVTLYPIAIRTGDFNKVANTRAIRFKIRVGDPEQERSAIYKNSPLRIKIGVTGDVKAMLDLNKLLNNDTKNNK